MINEERIRQLPTIFINHYSLIIILFLALFLRTLGLNWDQNQHLHPDERFLTMVDIAIKWANNFHDYLDTSTSPLNPNNVNFGFFVYGTFPLFLTKFIAEKLNWSDYGTLTLVGRFLSALFDSLTVFLVYKIGQKVAKKDEIGLIAAFFYAISVLPIQLAHFFTVDTYLNFFLTLCFLLLLKIRESFFQVKKILYYSFFLGISFGLACASKINAVIFLPVIGIGLITLYFKLKKVTYLFIITLCFILSAYLTFRITQPYAFANSQLFTAALNPQLISNLQELKSWDNPEANFPPGVQWITTKPLIFPLKNLIFWGLGVPLSAAALFGLFYLIWQTLKRTKLPDNLTDIETFNIILMLFWVLLLFGYQGTQYVKTMRYFLPIYPFLAITAAYFVYLAYRYLKSKFSPRTTAIISGFYLLLILIWPLAFLSIYLNPHSRVQASEWIYQNIPAGSVLSSEYWDDPLPLNLNGQSSAIYPGVSLHLYDQDTPEKKLILDQQFKQIDYIILSSNRVYGSITTVPNKYPKTNEFYQKLFNGSLGFQKVAEFTSRPTLPFPIPVCIHFPFQKYGIIAQAAEECKASGIQFVDDYAEEAFTVYDHPKVIIFHKMR